MSDPTLPDKLIEIAREVFDNPTLTLAPETVAADVEEWDSFNHINLLVAIEVRFGIKFRTFEVEELKNFGDLVALVAEKTR